MPYPEHPIAVYYGLWDGQGVPTLSTVPPQVNVLNLAFAAGDPPRLVGTAGRSQDVLISDVQRLRQRGVRIIISIGGEGETVTVAHKEAFVQGIMDINRVIPLDGLDWDLEGPALTANDVVWISSQLRRLRGPSFALTMAPHGGNVEEYLPVGVALHRQGLLTMFAQQYYNADIPLRDVLARLQQQRLAGLPENLIGVGMMVGTDNTSWTVSECEAAMITLLQRYPHLRGVYLWQLSRPQTSTWATRMQALLP